MNSVIRFISAGVLTLAGLYAGQSDAEVVITGTRVIYPGAQHEVSVQLTNKGKRPALVQVWVDDGAPDAKPTESTAPFVLTPPLARMEAGKGQVIRIMHAPAQMQMPADRESLYWFNMLEIPPKANPEEGQNLMQYAVKTRIKLIYRPKGLPGNAIDAPGKVTWSLADSQGSDLVVKAHNPTPYYVNFASLGVQSGNSEVQNLAEGGGKIAPGETATFMFPGARALAKGDLKILLTAISDLGGAIRINKPITR